MNGMQTGMEGGDPAILTRAAAKGRGGDSMLAHVTPGDFVVPRDAWMEDPAILQRVKKVMENSGADYRSHMVGSGYENINPETGEPEFGFFSNLFKPKNLIRLAATVAGGVLLPGVGLGIGSALGAGLGSAAGTLVTGGNLKEAAINGVGAYAGGKFLGSGSGDVAGNLSSNSATRSLGETLASSSGGSLLGQIGAASVPAITGAVTGQNLAGSLSGALEAPALAEQAPSAPSAPAGPTNAPVSRQQEAAIPSGLGDFSSLDPLQRATGLATKGLDGGGLGQDEQDYFTNLINRRLIDDQGNYGDINSVTPVEKGYLENGLGLQFDPNAKSLLQSIANRQARV